MDCLLDFGSIGDWEPKLTEALGGLLPIAFRQRLLAAELQGVENAQELLVELPPLDRNPVVDGVPARLRSTWSLLSKQMEAARNGRIPCVLNPRKEADKLIAD